jgi:hypothetical protein
MTTEYFTQKDQTKHTIVIQRHQTDSLWIDICQFQATPEGKAAGPVDHLAIKRLLKNKDVVMHTDSVKRKRALRAVHRVESTI